MSQTLCGTQGGANLGARNDKALQLEEHTMKLSSRIPMRAVIFAAGETLAAGVQAQETFKLGIVSFLSGPAAESFGVPAVNGAKVVIEAFNKGTAPAPYNKVGFGGAPPDSFLDIGQIGTAAPPSRCRSCAICTTAKRSMPWSATSAQATAWRWRRWPRK
jgi:hypothetical protein